MNDWMCPTPPPCTHYSERRKYLKKYYHLCKHLAHYTYRRPNGEPLCSVEMVAAPWLMNKVIEMMLQYELYYQIILPNYMAPPKPPRKNRKKT
jgi:hypothetical protein